MAARWSALVVLLLAGCGSEPEPSVHSDAPLATATAHVFAQGASIAGANGLQTGPDGLLYVASVMGSEIVVLDPETGEVRRRLTAADGVVGPDDVAFAPNGGLYWTSIMTGEVAGFGPDGDRVVAAQLAPGVNPITFSDDGRLFVAQCFLGDGLFELDPAGKRPPRLIADDLGPGCALNGMDWGPDGRLYGPRWFTGQVVSFDVDNGTRRIEAEGLGVPAAVKFDSGGRLHVLDTQGGRLLRLNDGAVVEVATLEPGLDNFAFDARDRLFVSSFADGSVVRLDAEGRTTELLPGGMVHPGGVTVRQRPDGTAELVVADLHALRGFHIDSGEATLVQRNIVAVGPLGSVISVAADGAELILTAFSDNSVRIWDPEARRMVQRYDDLDQPVSAIPYAGGIAVAEHGSGRVILLSRDGGPVRETVLAARLTAPTGLASDGTRLFVTDRSRGEVIEIAGNGAAVMPRVLVGGLDAPEGLAVWGDDLVVVEGETGRVLRISAPSGGETVAAVSLLAVVAPGSPAPDSGPPSMILNDVVVHGGDVYVTGETSRVLYRIDGPQAAGIE